MKYWSRFPVFRILIPFGSGIFTAINIDCSFKHFVIFTMISFVLSVLFAFRNYATGKYAQRWLAGIPFYSMFFGIGVCLLWLNQTKNFSNHFSTSDNFIIVKIMEPPVATSKGFRLTTSVEFQKMNNKWEGCNGNLLIYVKDTSNSFSAERYDKLMLKCKPLEIPPSGNPNAFNYQKYLETKGLYYQCFTNTTLITLLEKSTEFSFLKTADKLRNTLLGCLLKHLYGNEQLGVAGALLLGYEEWLDPELESKYKAAGVLHILCVSGMHVGLVYLIFSWLLFWMNRKKWLLKLRFPILIAFVWFYAMLTGASPSVVRAATMLTVVIVGQWLDKNSNIYNSLCASCVLMFTFDPFLIASAGFQLSFLAVCGIVTLHTLIYPLWMAPNNFLNKVWELISISISAQLTTFPLSLFLFHQFPNYFLIGNLILIPISTIVMYAGIGLLTFGWIPVLGIWIGKIAAISIDFLNYLVVFIGSLPGAVTENISINLYEMILIFLFMIAFTCWLIVKSRSWLYGWLSVLSIFLCIRIAEFHIASKTHLFTVYSQKNKAICSIICNRKAIIFTNDKQNIKFAAGEHLQSKMVNYTHVRLLQPNTVTFLNQDKIIIVNDWPKQNTVCNSSTHREVDLLVLGGNIEVDSDTILNYFHPAKVVFNSAIKMQQLNKLTAGFQEKGIETYDISKKGAFIAEL